MKITDPRGMSGDEYEEWNREPAGVVQCLDCKTKLEVAQDGQLKKGEIIMYNVLTCDSMEGKKGCYSQWFKFLGSLNTWWNDDEYKSPPYWGSFSHRNRKK